MGPAEAITAYRSGRGVLAGARQPTPGPDRRLASALLRKAAVVNTMWPRRSHSSPIVLAILLGSACGNDSVPLEPDASEAIPDPPAYVEHVAPILGDYCTGCHGAPTTTSEARNCIRVDRWDSTPDPMGLCSDSVTAGEIFGARDGGPMIVDNIVTKRMPVGDRTLTDRELQIFERWRAAGFPKRAVDQPPAIELTTPPAGGVTVCAPDCTYQIRYATSDPDGDSIRWSLGWSGNGAMGTFATNLAGGSGAVTIDASPLASGTYMLTATLDDGTVTVSSTAAGTLTVSATHNAAPTVMVTAPNGGESFYGGQPLTITWSGSDSDGTMLAYDVSAVGAATIPIQTLTAPVGPAQVTWTPPAVTSLTPYRIQVTAHDGGTPSLSATDQSDAAFAISPPPQAVSFASQLQPILTASCTGAQCHDAMIPASGLQLTAGTAYGALVNVSSKEAPCTSYKLVAPGKPDQSYLVFKLQGTGTCFSGGVMPKGMPALSPTQLQLFRDWIANGAPNN